MNLDTVVCGNCLEIMSVMPDNSVNLIVADLPYGTTACEWDKKIPLESMWKEFRRLTGRHKPIVLFSSQPFTSELVMSNQKQFRCEWVWQKTLGGGFLNANRHPLKRHENILIFSYGAPIYNPQFEDGKPYRCTRAAAGETTFDQTVAGWTTENNGYRYPTTNLEYASETGLHPTQKPLELLKYLIRIYSNPGDIVLDPVIGSGTTAVAALKLGRYFYGCDINPGYVKLANQRIEKTRLEMSQMEMSI